MNRSVVKYLNISEGVLDMFKKYVDPDAYEEIIGRIKRKFSNKTSSIPKEDPIPSYRKGKPTYGDKRFYGTKPFKGTDELAKSELKRLDDADTAAILRNELSRTR